MVAGGADCSVGSRVQKSGRPPNRLTGVGVGCGAPVGKVQYRLAGTGRAGNRTRLIGRPAGLSLMIRDSAQSWALGGVFKEAMYL